MSIFLSNCVLMVLQLLDFLLGHGHVALFRRAELKTLVDLHGNEVCMTTSQDFWISKLKS